MRDASRHAPRAGPHQGGCLVSTVWLAFCELCQVLEHTSRFFRAPP